MIYALVEGLAGVKDLSTGFDKALLAPRWSAAGVNRADVTIKYESSGGYVCYRYHHKKRDNSIVLELTGSGDEIQAQILLPNGMAIKEVFLAGEKVPFEIKRVEQSSYACLSIKGIGAHRVRLEVERS